MHKLYKKESTLGRKMIEQRLINLLINNIIMKTKKMLKFIAWCLGGVFVFIGLLVSVIFIVLPFYLNFGGLPSDEELMNNFEEHHAEFQYLVSLIQEDYTKGVYRVASDFTFPEDALDIVGISRIQQYRDIFRELDLKTGFYVGENGIEFMFDSIGISISGASKGYVYSEKEVKNYFKENNGYSLEPVESIDNFDPPNDYSYKIYQKIADNWYLYYDYED
jgi:hypothetical protein